MRTIKFRGKCKSGYDYSNGDRWVYGSLLTDLKDSGIVRYEDVSFGNGTDDGISSLNDFSYIPVENDSVGQFTGLQDKNKKEIYEGDILKIKCLGWEYARVVFHCGVFGFYVTENSRLCAHVPQYWEDGEIIGNIHDNPELIPVY